MMRGKPIFVLFGIIIVVAMILLIFRKGGNDQLAQSMPATERQTTSVAEISHQDAVSISKKTPSISAQQTKSTSLASHRLLKRTHYPLSPMDLLGFSV